MRLICLLLLGGCAAAGFDSEGLSKDGGTICGDTECPIAFHCELDTCVADPPSTPTPPADPAREDPLASHRFVFTLERETKRLVRIDSATLAVDSFPAGLAPMDLGVVGAREQTLLLDALDLVEVLDHREEPPRSVPFTTARALSHLVLSPTGAHAIAYFDWDDGRAQERQPEPGNINQVSVLWLDDATEPMSEADPRLIDVAVGFLPRDVRFAADGSRAVVLGKETLTPIDLLPMPEVALVHPDIRFDEAAADILLDDTAATAVLRYADSPRLDAIALDGSAPRCLEAPGNVLDAVFDRDGRLVVLYEDGRLSIADLADATPEPCATIAEGIETPNARTLVADKSGPYVLAYQANLEVETMFVVDAAAGTLLEIELEKAAGGIAFAGDGRYALVAHLKRAGTPAWNPAIEDPEISVDKAYGTSWIDMQTGAHRLAVNDAPFGPFTFVPATTTPAATFQAVLDPEKPQLLRVSHAAGFDDAWVDLAAVPLAMGYLPDTARAYVTQDHPWGRVTFLDTAGGDLRHVTGFALSQE